MANTVVGLFDDPNDAHGAVQDLMAAGYTKDKISLVATDPNGEYHKYGVDTEGNLAGEGAASGLASGSVVGGLIGLLIGAGAIFAAPAVLVAGPFAGLIAGAAAGAATGGIFGGLIGLGIPKEHAEYYAEGVRRGGTLVTVTVDESETQRVKDLLDRDGAVDIEQRADYYQKTGYSGYDKDAPAYAADRIAQERDELRAYGSDETLSTGIGTAAASGRIKTYAYADTPTGVPSAAQPAIASTPTGTPNGVPGVQTGGHATDGTSDTRGVTEKLADKLTGDHTDDKTGKPV